MKSKEEMQSSKGKSKNTTTVVVKNGTQGRGKSDEERGEKNIKIRNRKDDWW